MEGKRVESIDTQSVTNIKGAVAFFCREVIRILRMIASIVVGFQSRAYRSVI
jgi:hypothetical protein